MNIVLDYKKFNGEFGIFELDGERVIIAKPHTFMNLSGDFVANFIKYYKLDIDDVIVIYDDVDTNIGQYKIRTSGSAGGQNGMKDIISKLGTNNIKRIKVGVGPKNKAMVLSDFVLSNFSKDETMIISNVINTITDKLKKINEVDFTNLG